MVSVSAPTSNRDRGCQGRQQLDQNRVLLGEPFCPICFCILLCAEQTQAQSICCNPYSHVLDVNLDFGSCDNESLQHIFRTCPVLLKRIHDVFCAIAKGNIGHRSGVSKTRLAICCVQRMKSSAESTANRGSRCPGPVAGQARQSCNR